YRMSSDGGDLSLPVQSPQRRFRSARAWFVTPPRAFHARSFSLRNTSFAAISAGLDASADSVPAAGLLEHDVPTGHGAPGGFRRRLDDAGRPAARRVRGLAIRAAGRLAQCAAP